MIGIRRFHPWTRLGPRSKGICLLLCLLASVSLACDRSKPAAVSAGSEAVSTDSKPANAASASEREVIDRFYAIWGDRERGTIWENRFFGIRTVQNPMDVWITQEIIWEVKPDFIVECGTAHGGSALLWATLLEQVNPDGRVITIDIKNAHGEAEQRTLWKRRVESLTGDSVAPEIVQQVADRVKGGKVLVILDSLHTRDHVLAELEAYAPMVNLGSYVIVQDSFLNGHPLRPDWGPGPYEAVADWSPEKHGFEIDLSRERLLLTYNPNGYLKRVR